MRNATPTSRRISKTLMIAAAGLIGISLSASSVSALLTAEAKNTAAQQITSGTLKLTYSDNGAGFTTAISNMAPGDVVNRYADYTNSGSLASKLLRLKVTDAAPGSLLSTSATKGLQLVVSNCSVAWNPTAGTCGGTTTQVIASTPLSSMGTDKFFVNTTDLVANTGALHLQFSLTLPDAPNDELSTNGTLPSPTIQGLTANLTWTLTETQRDLINATNS